MNAIIPVSDMGVMAESIVLLASMDLKQKSK